MMTYLILILQFVCLSIWIGGSTVIVVMAAPSIFDNIDLQSAGAIMGLLMRRFVGILTALQILLLGSLYLQLLVLSNSLNLKLRLALSFTALAILLTVYLRFTLLPRINELRSTLSETDESRESRQKRIYKRSQGRSLMALAVNLFLGLCVVITLILPF